VVLPSLSFLCSYSTASRHRGIRDLERFVDNPERVPQLLLGDAKRRIGEEIVLVDEDVHPLLAQIRA